LNKPNEEKRGGLVCAVCANSQKKANDCFVAATTNLC
jgi:hypothetical protein